MPPAGYFGYRRLGAHGPELVRRDYLDALGYGVLVHVGPSHAYAQRRYVPHVRQVEAAAYRAAVVIEGALELVAEVYVGVEVDHVQVGIAVKPPHCGKVIEWSPPTITGNDPRATICLTAWVVLA